MKKLNKKGFTLVELLAVIVILALLMVVATRTIGSSLTNSKQNALKSEAQKVVSKVYEVAKTKTLEGTLSELADFNDANASAFDTTKKIVTVNEGDYTIYVKITALDDTVDVSEFCAQGSGYSVGKKISGPSITFPSDWGNNVTDDTEVNTTMLYGKTCSVSDSGSIIVEK